MHDSFYCAANFAWAMLFETRLSSDAAAFFLTPDVDGDRRSQYQSYSM